jgi:putative membrane protein
MTLLVALCLVGAGSLYLHAERLVAARSGRRPHPWRRRSFLAGVIAILVALTGPLDAAAETSLTMHMVQHLLLTMIAAPLIVLAAPVTLALRAWPGTGRRRILVILHSGPMRLLANPLVAWALFFGAMWITHVSGLYELALRNDSVHAAGHLTYLATALLFWMPVVGVEPTPSGLSYPARILYLFLAMPAMAFLGLVIYSARPVLYPTYAAAEGAAKALADQRAAGALMWEGAMIFVVPALVFVMMAWMRAEEREGKRFDDSLGRGRAT